MNSNEIAKIAGVSRSTVSRVMNGYANVPPETRSRVMAVVEKYGYTPNNAARNLAGKRSRIVGLFFIDLDAKNTNIVHSSPFFSEFLTFTADKLQTRGFQLLTSVVRDKAQFGNILSLFREQTISGAILLGELVPQPLLRELSANKCFSILVNQLEEANLENILILNTENYQGAFAAVETLIRMGHRRIAHIAGLLDKTSTKNRFEGYRDCLLRHDIPFDERLVASVNNIHREESGYHAMLSLMAANTGKPPTAVFSGNDLMAFGAMRALGELGLRIPDDISLIGYDNTESSRFTSPTLSTVATSLEALSGMAVDSLFTFIEYGRVENPVMMLKEFEVIVRGSVAELKR